MAGDAHLGVEDREHCVGEGRGRRSRRRSGASSCGSSGKDVAATQAAIRSIKKAGAPSSANGSKIQSKVIAAFQSASDVFAEAKSVGCQPLDDGSPPRSSPTRTKIQQDLNGASRRLPDATSPTVQKLDSKGEIGQAITSAKACKFLTG